MIRRKSRRSTLRSKLARPVSLISPGEAISFYRNRPSRFIVRPNKIQMKASKRDAQWDRRLDHRFAFSLVKIYGCEDCSIGARRHDGARSSGNTFSDEKWLFAFLVGDTNLFRVSGEMVTRVQSLLFFQPPGWAARIYVSPIRKGGNESAKLFSVPTTRRSMIFDFWDWLSQFLYSRLNRPHYPKFYTFSFLLVFSRKDSQVSWHFVLDLSLVKFYFTIYVD